jgi:DNA-binding NarL/FixJ family response regulator
VGEEVLDPLDLDLVRVGLRTLIDSEDDLTWIAEAADGLAAVSTAKRTRPDVILMDIRMPGTDGLDATRQLLTDQPPPTRVVVLTTFDDDDLVVQALRSGASGYLLKDLPRQQLVDAIRAVHDGDLRLSPSITRRLVDRHTHRAASPEQLQALQRLSHRESEVLRLVARGLSNAEIAAELYLSESTVKTHVGRVLAKVGVRDRVHLVVVAYETGVAY